MVKKRLALALGAGGYRGLAHIGILKGFENNNISIDYLSGSSMGAVIGSFYAAGMSAGEIRDLVLEFILKFPSFSLSDFIKALITTIKTIINRTGIIPERWLTIPHGFINGNIIYDNLQKHLGKTRFDQLKIPLSVMAADIISGKGVGFVNGEFPVHENHFNDIVYYRNEIVVDAVMASISLPIIFNPMLYDGRYLVDGGVKNSVPVNLLTLINADIIIGVDLGFDYQNYKKSGDPLSVGAQALDIMRSGNSQLQLERYADIIICPQIDKVNVINENALLNIIKAGEKAVAEKLPQIRELLER